MVEFRLGIQLATAGVAVAVGYHGVATHAAAGTKLHAVQRDFKRGVNVVIAGAAAVSHGRGHTAIAGVSQGGIFRKRHGFCIRAACQ